MFAKLILYGLIGSAIGAGVGTLVSATTDKWDQSAEYAGYGALAGGAVLGLGMLVVDESTRDHADEYFTMENDGMDQGTFVRENPMRMPMSRRRTYQYI